MTSTTYPSPSSVTPASEWQTHWQLVESLLVKADWKNAEIAVTQARALAWQEPRWAYQLGNWYDTLKLHDQALSAWQHAAELTQKRPEKKIAPSAYTLKTLHNALWRTVSVTLLLMIGLFLLLLQLFSRDWTRLDMMLAQMEERQAPKSWWEEFWDSRRPQSAHEHGMEGEYILPYVRRQIEKLFDFSGESKKKPLNLQEQMVEWLNERYRNLPMGSTQPVDYNLIASKGLFNLRRFDEAESVLQNAIDSTFDNTKRSIYYQELATTYYYQGYHLQPDGLAKYDLNLVKKSVEAYEKAKSESGGPFLFGNLGWGYYLLQDYERSIANSLAALKQEPHLNYVRMNLGLTYLRINQYDLSLKSYQQMFDYALEDNELDGGIRDIRELKREFPQKYPFAHFILGFIFQQKGEYRLAREEYENFLKQPFEDPSWIDDAKERMEMMSKAAY